MSFLNLELVNPVRFLGRRSGHFSSGKIWEVLLTGERGVLEEVISSNWGVSLTFEIPSSVSQNDVVPELSGREVGQFVPEVES